MTGVPPTTISETHGNRLSRRAALQRAGLGGAAVALAASAPHAAAQTPDASPAATREISLLFVQSFESGSLSPTAGQSGQYTLTVQHGVGHTVYFSDRPERLAGSMPTADFLKVMAFSDPPNAAFVVQLASGTKAIAVLELSTPEYDPAVSTLTYVARLLPGSDYLDFDQEPLTAQTLPASFKSASLFIDTQAVVGAQGGLDAFNNTRVAQKFDFFQHID